MKIQLDSMEVNRASESDAWVVVLDAVREYIATEQMGKRLTEFTTEDGYEGVWRFAEMIGRSVAYSVEDMILDMTGDMS